MSEFGDRFAAHMPRMLSRMGDSVTVTLPSGTTLTRTAVANREAYIPDVTSNMVWHFSDNATTGLTAATAIKGATITFNGIDWIMLDPRRDEDGGWEVKCVTAESIG